MTETCKVCGGTNFEEDWGLKSCLECGTQVIGYHDLQSQEFTNEINVNRFRNIADDSASSITTEISNVEEDNAPERTTDWTNFEAFNIILNKWTSILIENGASEKFRLLVFKFWVQYLKVCEVGFFDEGQECDPTKFVYKRDFYLIANNQSSVIRRKLTGRRKKVLNKKPRKRKKRPSRRERRKQKGLTMSVLKQLSQTIDTETDYKSEATSDTNTSYWSCDMSTDYESIFTSNCENLADSSINSTLPSNMWIKPPNANRGEPSAFKRQPSRLTLSHIFSILYLAVLYAEEDFLLMDLLRWLREEHLPYKSINCLMPKEFEFVAMSSDIQFFDFNAKTYLKQEDTVEKISITATVLSLKSVPLPDVNIVLKKMLNFFLLPDSLYNYALNILSIDIEEYLNEPKDKPIYSVEVSTAAAIILSLKVLYGLNDKNEHYLSAVADKLNSLFSEVDSSIQLFSFSSWKSHIDGIYNWCNQMDDSKDSIQDTERLKNNFWQHGVWTLNSCEGRVNEDVQRLTSLQGKKWEYEKLLNEPRIFEPSRNPLLGKLYQYVAHPKKDKGSNAPQMFMRCKKLLRTSFKGDMAAWACNLKEVQEIMDKNKIKIQLVNSKSCKGSKARYCRNDCSIASINNLSTESTFVHICIPPSEINNYKTYTSIIENYPLSFQWVIQLFANVCEASISNIFERLRCFEKHLFTKHVHELYKKQ